MCLYVYAYLYVYLYVCVCIHGNIYTHIFTADDKKGHRHLRGSNLLHLLKGSPTKPRGQEQMGWWFLTVHSEPWPHTPTPQGSMHLRRWQVRCPGQSLASVADKKPEYYRYTNHVNAVVVATVD